MDLPEGYYLKENEAPELEKTIKDLSVKLNTPTIHRIVVDDEYNAAVVQHPKFGLFGPKENILMIGLPLVSSLTREQFTSVLAHELAHISHSDTAFGAMIYRVRMTWAQLMDSLEKNEQFGTFLFRKFITWFYPRYSAYTFVMARQEEYAADATAARVTSPEAVRDTLCTISVGGQYFYRHYFDELFEESAKTNKVPQPYSNYSTRAQLLDKSMAVEFLTERLEMKSSVVDTHPCLMDRLQAVGMEPVVPENKEFAIDYFFANGDSVVQHFNKMWLENNGERWNEQVASFKEAKERLKELEGLELDNVNDLYEKAILTRDIVGADQALPLFEEIIDQYPAERVAPAYLALGDLYLRKEATAPRGEELVRQAMEISWECKEEALDILCGFYYQTGQYVAFEETRAQLEAWSDRLKQFEEECGPIDENDQYVPHDLSDEDLEVTLESIGSQSEISEAYLVRKIIEVIPERKSYVLALKVKLPEGTDYERYTDQLMEKFTQELHTIEDTYFTIINGFEDLEKAVKVVEGSLVYDASHRPSSVEVS